MNTDKKAKSTLASIQFTRIARKLRLPFVLHRSGKGRGGAGSCWVVESLYPVTGTGEKHHACGATLVEALGKFYRGLKLMKPIRVHPCLPPVAHRSVVKTKSHA